MDANLTPPTLASRLLTPFQQFVRSESAGGLILIFTAAIAFAWANTPWAHGYFEMKHVPFGLRLGDWALVKPLELWVNDGLMAIFFLLVGLEIKRELLTGELAGFRKAMLPALAAVGGMIVPAVLYASVNWGTPQIRGWGIPMATDIAFALGVLSLLGRRVPLALKVFLTALAIVDDLGAVLVIALFYTETLNVTALAVSLGLVAVCLLYGLMNGRRMWVFILLGVLMWYFMLKSGVHATVAGVLLALTVPISRASAAVPREGEEKQPGVSAAFEQAEAALQQEPEQPAEAQSLLHRLEHALQPWVAYAIMPVFALFNAGISLAGEGATISPINTGIFLGLLFGKPIGIVGFSWIGHRLGWVSLPAGADWRAMAGVGILGGIGFTMSLFVATLAFPAAEELDQAKLGVLITSVTAAVVGLAATAWATRAPAAREATAIR